MPSYNGLCQPIGLKNEAIVAGLSILEKKWGESKGDFCRFGAFLGERKCLII